MSLSKEVREIMQQLIRNRFDALRQHELMTTGPTLVNIAREMGFTNLAEGMERDLRLELPPHAHQLAKRKAA